MDEFLINTTTAGDQEQPAVAALRGTQFVAVWADRASGTIKGQLLGVNGAKSSSEFAINFPGKVGTKRTLPAVIETDLGFVAAWIEQEPSAGPQLKLRTFDADSLSGPEAQVSSAEVEPLIRPALARLAAGAFVVVWADKRASERIRAQHFGADGAKAGTEFRANTVPGLHRVPMVAALTNGNIVIAWRARLPGALVVHFQIFNPAKPVGTEVTTALDITEAAMTALDSGRFPGWKRTGWWFRVSYAFDHRLAAPAAGPWADVCRFYLPPPSDSHFFSASAEECDAVRKAHPEYTLENASAFQVSLVREPTNQLCSLGFLRVAVYRFWNGRADSNHRYVSDPGERASMLLRGWIAEGTGPDTIAFCVDDAGSSLPSR